MCTLNNHKETLSLCIFVLLFICHNSNGYLFKRSPVGVKGQNFDDGNRKIVSEEDPSKDPGAGPSKPDTMPHTVTRRQSLASFSRLYLCKWLNPREELLSLPMCTRIGDFPYLNECRVFRHCINVGSTTVKACCPVGSHFDHILRECVNAKDARCLTRDLQDQFMDSAFYEESGVDLPHTDTDIIHVDEYVDDVHDKVVREIVDPIDDGDDDSEPLDDSFEVIDPSVLVNNDKTWKYYPAPPHLYPGAFWNHNPYTGRMEPGKFGYAMPIWMSYNVEPVQKIRPPRKLTKPWKKQKRPVEGDNGEGDNGEGDNGVRMSRDQYNPKAGLTDEGDDDEAGESENSGEKKKMDWSGQSFDENDKSGQPTSSPVHVIISGSTPPPPPPFSTPIPVTTTTTMASSSQQSIVISMIPVPSPATPPPFAPFKPPPPPPTKPLPPVELIKFTTNQPGAMGESEEENGFEVDTIITENKTPPKIPNENLKVNAPVGRKSNEPPPPLVGILGKSGFDTSSEEDNGKDKRKRSGEIMEKDHDDAVHQAVIRSVTQAPSSSPPVTTVKRQVGNENEDKGQGQPGQSEKQLSVLPDFENSIEEGEGGISNGGIQNERSQFGNENVEQGIESQPVSPKRKRQVPMVMRRRRIIPRRRPDYFYYNY